MEAPIPAVPEALAEIDAVRTRADISEALTASRSTSPALFSTLFSTYALVLFNMTLVASAPAPLSDTPAPEPPIATAAEAAAESADILAVSFASSVIAPPVVLTPVSAFVIYDSTSLLISLRAMETPIETDTPAVPPTEPAMDPAPAYVMISAVSTAFIVIVSALIPPVPSPSM